MIKISQYRSQNGDNVEEIKTVLFVNKQRAQTLDCGDIIDEFANVKDRRMQFL